MGNEYRCIEEQLVELVNTFLKSLDQWLEDGVIDKGTYTYMRKEKVRFIEEVSSLNEEKNSHLL